jgi:membrane-bound serine protease (ClpP class)
VVPLRGEIDDYNRDSFERRFNQARAMGAKVVIVRLNTYGGLVTSGLDLSRFLKNQKDVHTIAYLDDKAISAGAMIAMACDEIVMVDDAVIGDCAPISINQSGQLEPLPPAERAKLEGPVVVDFLDSAARNHHDPLLAQAMVSVQTTVYWLQSPVGERRFVEEKEAATLTNQGWKPVDPKLPNPIDSSTTLLTVHTAEALELGLASGQASTVEQLAGDRHLKILADLEPSPGESVIDWLNQGVVRMGLMIIFVLALYIALHAPGHGMAEAVALCALALLVGVPLLTGYATWWEILIIFLGLALIAVEIFVLPHAGVMLSVGALMMVVGFVLTFVGLAPGGQPGLWHLPQTWDLLKHGLFYVVAALFCSMVIAFWISRYLPKLPIFGRLVLMATSGSVAPAAWKPVDPSATPPDANAWPRMGMVGRTLTPLRPGGSVEFFDEASGDSRTVIVQSESGYVQSGASVIVHEVSGNHVKVRLL